MSFRLVTKGWDQLLGHALQADRSNTRIVCPFIKKRPLVRLFGEKPEALRVITRFNLRDFSEGVSDLAAMEALLEMGAQVRGIRDLHTKLYLFGKSRAIVTSANLTEAALTRNHELGFVTGDIAMVGHCGDYFDDLWAGAGKDLTKARLQGWRRKVTTHLAQEDGRDTATPLGDEGVAFDSSTASLVLPGWVGEAEQAFVKFFGKSDNRADRGMAVLEEIRRSGCHWACTYPRGRHPRGVSDGASMFMGRPVKRPVDILVFGRAVGMRYVEGRDDATAADVRLRPWKNRWPHYVRVHNAEFVGGTLASGVSLTRMIEVLKADAFTSTQRNASQGEGNVNPRKAYMRQPAVELAPQGVAWLSDQLDAAFARHGSHGPRELDGIE